MAYVFFRLGFISLMAAAGFRIGGKLNMAMTGLGIGFALGIILVFIEIFLKDLSIRGLTSGLFGAVLGMLMAKIVKDIMITVGINHDFVNFSYPVLTFMFLYIGFMFSLKKKDEFAIVLPYVRFKRSDRRDNALLLDTSALIDGRVFNIIKTGFLQGRVIIPRFVLRELQALADSRDNAKRNKGRKALNLLEEISRDKNVDFDVYEEDFQDVEGVDEKLIRLAKLLDAYIITMDYNLNKVASMQSILVLNINDLANAVKQVHFVGDEFKIRLNKEGKERGQAIGYTDDGTMVVVENGRNMIGRQVKVEVSNIIQTSAGRILFARLIPMKNT